MPTALTTICGIIPEAIFFSIFIIIAKDIKEKRITFTICMILNYYVCKVLASRSPWFYILYTIMFCIILKVLYKDTEFIDIFLFSLSSLVLMVVSGICLYVLKNVDLNYWILYSINRIFIFAFLFIFRKQIKEFYTKYRKAWNRNADNKFRSISVRNISLIALNIMMYILNLSLVIISVEGG